MKLVKVYLPEETINLIQKQADYRRIPRSKFIRQRLSESSVPTNLTPHDFYSTVAKVRQRYSYGLDRQQTESVVAAVFSELFDQSRDDQIE